jgi:hypothetical protein
VSAVVVKSAKHQGLCIVVLAVCMFSFLCVCQHQVLSL